MKNTSSNTTMFAQACPDLSGLSPKAFGGSPTPSRFSGQVRLTVKCDIGELETMNKEILKYTTKYENELLEDLKDPMEAQFYLEAAFELYAEDGNTESLLLALQDVARAQGGIGKLAEQTDISRQHLYKVLSSKHNPRLDNLLDVLLGLGFRIRLERQDIAAEEKKIPAKWS